MRSRLSPTPVRRAFAQFAVLAQGLDWRRVSVPQLMAPMIA